MITKDFNPIDLLPLCLLIHFHIFFLSLPSSSLLDICSPSSSERFCELFDPAKGECNEETDSQELRSNNQRRRRGIYCTKEEASPFFILPDWSRTTRLSRLERSCKVHIDDFLVERGKQRKQGMRKRRRDREKIDLPRHGEKTKCDPESFIAFSLIDRNLRGPLTTTMRPPQLTFVQLEKWLIDMSLDFDLPKVEQAIDLSDTCSLGFWETVCLTRDCETD